MSKLSDADFVETDTTYNELIYLFNATVFDFNLMKWAVVARMCVNQEYAEFYKTAFQLMFQTCQSDFPQFKPENSAKLVTSVKTKVVFRVFDVLQGTQSVLQLYALQI